MRIPSLIICLIVLVASNAFALSYQVYDSGTPGAYIQRQPEPGVFLGEMMRKIGLQPNWTDRRWIRMVHQANPAVVDAQGEITNWDRPLVFPLAALKTLKGYKSLENYFTTVPMQAEAPVETPVEEPVLPPTQPEVMPEPEVVEAEPVVVEDSFSETYPTGYILISEIGGGGEFLSVDNNLGNNTDLQTEFSLVARLQYLVQFHSDHQLIFKFTGQYKTYQPPSNIGVSEDANFLMTFQYGYGYRLFNHFNLRVVGQSQQQNFVVFPGNIIDIFTYWNHMAGLQVQFPVVFIGPNQISVDVAGFYTLETSADFAMDNGIQVRGGIYYEPQGLESGFRLGVYGLFHNQLPTGYLTHQSTEAFGVIGYQF